MQKIVMAPDYCDVGPKWLRRWRSRNHHGEVFTINFVLDGVEYEIETCAGHRWLFVGPPESTEQHLRTYVRNARRLGPVSTPIVTSG